MPRLMWPGWQSQVLKGQFPSFAAAFPLASLLPLSGGFALLS